eukprot:2014031-Rhodomonas_salina.1
MALSRCNLAVKIKDAAVRTESLPYSHCKPEVDPCSLLLPAGRNCDAKGCLNQMQKFPQLTPSHEH